MRFLLLLLLIVLPMPVFGEGEAPLTAQADPVRLMPGETGQVKLRLRLQGGWHTFPPQVQRNAEGQGPAPMAVGVRTPSRLEVVGEPRLSPLLARHDEGFEMMLLESSGEATLEVPVRVSQGVPAGRLTEVLTLRYQVCKEGRCLPSTTVEIPVSLEIQPTRGTRGLGAYLGWAALAGGGALLTPCVFPMVPITVSFFTKRAEGRRRRSLRDALCYGLGIMGTFTGLGILLATLLGATGIQAFAAHPLLNLGLAALFVGFACNLFGALEVRLPGSWTARLGSKGDGSGLGGVMVMGLTFSLTSFTCTVPFVGSALVAASRGEWFQPILGMLTFSAVFALPFVGLALFPSLLGRLPKGGGWMHHLKVVMGFLELAAAVKFLSNADLAWSLGWLTRDRFLALWMVCALMIAMYLLGIFRLALDQAQEGLSAARVLAATAFAALGCYLGTGLAGKPLGELDAYLPPPTLTMATSSEAQDVDDGWMGDYQKALEVARHTGRPLFVDFTGYTCTNCRWMERNMFTRPAVSALLQKFVRVRLYTDRQVEPDLSHRRLQQARFQAIELPLYAVMQPDERPLATQSFTRDEGAFLAFLRSAIPEG